MSVAMYVRYVTAVLYNVSREKNQNYYTHYNPLYFLIKVCSLRFPFEYLSLTMLLRLVLKSTSRGVELMGGGMTRVEQEKLFWVLTFATTIMFCHCHTLPFASPGVVYDIIVSTECHRV